MRQVLVGLAVGLCLAGSGVAQAAPQESKTVRGTVSAVGKDSLTVKVKEQDMKFVVTAETEVIAPGGGTKTRAAQAAGKSGAAIDTVLKAGESVEVQYHPTPMHAYRVRVLSAGGAVAAAKRDTAAPAKVAAGKPKAASDKPKTETLAGTVSAMSGSSLTVKAAGGASTFTVDATTRVIGTGLGTKARSEAAAGKKLVLGEAVAVGDSVSVMYHEVAGVKHATEVHLKTKAAK